MRPIPTDALKLIIAKTIPQILQQPETDSVDVMVIVNSGPAKGKIMTVTVSLSEQNTSSG